MSGFDMKDYVPVNERVEQFYSTFPEGSIQSEIVELTETRVTVKAYAYRKPDDPRPGIGHSSLAIPGSTSFTKGSEIENAETSAWGRAIAALGFEVKRGIASAEEVRNKPATPARQAPPTARERLALVASEHGVKGEALQALGREVGIPAGEHGTDAQYEQIIALIEQPAQVPDAAQGSNPVPATTPQESVSDSSDGQDPPAPPAATTAVEAGHPTSEVPAADEASTADLIDDVLAVTGGELIEDEPPRPGSAAYKALPSGTDRANAKAYWDKKEPAAPKGARETPEPVEVTAGL